MLFTFFDMALWITEYTDKEKEHTSPPPQDSPVCPIPSIALSLQRNYSPGFYSTHFLADISGKEPEENLPIR